MIRINLLPYREEAKRARRKQFFSAGGLVALLAAMIVGFGYTVIGGYISFQNSENEFLQKEIAALDKDIEQIKRLKEQTQALLARKQIIESLQRDRGEAVNILNDFTRLVPDGIYLKSLRQDGLKISLVGYAQSNARVSTLMRNLENSQWLERPQLIEIKAVYVDKRRVSEFSMDLHLRRAQDDAEEKKRSGKGEK